MVPTKRSRENALVHAVVFAPARRVLAAAAAAESQI